VIGDRVRVAVVAVDRDASVEAHKRMWDAAVTAVEAVSRVPSLD
jgi:hypothetical protein